MFIDHFPRIVYVYQQQHSNEENKMGNEQYKKLNSDVSMAEWEVVDKEDFAPNVGKYSPSYAPQNKNNSVNNTEKAKDKTDNSFSDWTLLMDYKKDPKIVLPKGNKSEIIYYRKKEQTFTDITTGKDIKITTDFSFMDKMKFDLPESLFKDFNRFEDRKKSLHNIVSIRLPIFKKYYHDTYDGKDDDKIDILQKEADSKCLEFLEAVNSYADNNITAVDLYLERKKRDNRKKIAQISLKKYNKMIEDLKNELDSVEGTLEETEDRKKDLNYKIDSLQKIADDYQKEIDDDTKVNSMIAQFNDEAVMSTLIKKYLDKSDTLNNELRRFIAPFKQYFKREFKYGKGPDPNAEIKDYSNHKIIYSKLKTGSRKKDRKLLQENDYENYLENIPMKDCSDVPLFTHAPSVYDVSQGKLGNCYLISGIVSIVNDNPSFITEMMHDDGNGNAIVRFYYYDPATKKSKPVYYKVKKQIPDTDEYTFSRGPMWVKILEYAYAAYKTDFYERSNMQDIGPGLKTKNGIIDMKIEESGYSSESLAVFTGKKVNLYLNKKTGKNKKKLKTCSIYGDKTFDNYYKGLENSSTMSHSVADATYFTGKYSSHADNLFNVIKDTVNKKGKEKRSMIAAMELKVEAIQNKYLVESTDLNGTSLKAASEVQDGSGLLSRHAYIIIGTHEDKETGIKYVVMRNPWGLFNNNYYKDANGTVYSRFTETEKGGGICVVELNEFMNRLSDSSSL